jgi:hypothetical protein
MSFLVDLDDFALKSKEQATSNAKYTFAAPMNITVCYHPLIFNLLHGYTDSYSSF